MYSVNRHFPAEAGSVGPVKIARGLHRPRRPRPGASSSKQWRDSPMERLPIWFERAENLALAIAVVVVYGRLHFSWWWLPVFFLAFDASAVGYLVGNRAGAICYNLAHVYVAPVVLLLSYALTGTRWCAFVGLLWAFHIAVDRVVGYGLKCASSFQDTHLGRIGRQRLTRHSLAQ